MDKRQTKSSKEQEGKSVTKGNVKINDTEFWEKLKPLLPKSKKNVTLRLSPEVIEFFKSQGAKGYTTKMVSVLQSYYEAHKKS